MRLFVNCSWNLPMKKIVYYSCLAVSHLPWWLLYCFSSLLAWLVYHLHLYRYKVVTNNLRLAFPEKTDKERRRIARDFYQHFADSVVETLKMMSASDETLRKKVEFVGWEQLQEQVEARKSVVLYIGHYGNWELVPTVVWVIPPEFICAQIYKPLRDSLSSMIMERIRNRFGALNLPHKRAFYELLRLHREDKLTITGFIADQRPGKVRKYWLEFLGLPTAVMAGGEEIGKRINADYYYLDIECIGRGKTRFSLKKVVPVADAELPITAAYFRMLETTIRRDPAPWLWSHRRWAGQLNHKIS